MTAAGAGATPWGVRVVEPADWRQAARIAGAFALFVGLGNATIVFATPGLADHRGLFATVGLFSDLLGIGFVIAGLTLSDARLVRIAPPATLVALLASAAATPLALWAMGYPASGLASLIYLAIAILAFWLLVRWLAFVVVILMIVGHAVVEVVSATSWPAWLPTTWVAVGVLLTGYLVGQLISRLDASEKAARAAGDALADLNTNLEAKVAEQVGEVERLSRLRRFLSAPVAEALLTSSDVSPLTPHRREIAVLFCDLRGFTAFTKQVEPEEVMEVLDAYYAAAGEQITAFGATLGSFEGDGMMAYLNDPIPCDEPARRVVEMGLAIAEAIDGLTPMWQRRGYDLSYGIGMALGHATLGVVGYDGRSDYTALGTVVNLAARLCSNATARELLVDHRVFLKTEDYVRYTGREPVALKGFTEPVATYLVDRS
jgi:class 3 adenylate cyclase